jgi:signal transduction histidine kinase
MPMLARIADDPAARRRSRLLGAFLLVMIVLFAGLDGVGMLTQPGYTPPWSGYLFLASAWLLNRRGYYQVSAGLTLGMFPAVIFGEVLQRAGANPASTLAFLLPGLIVASILLPMWGLLLFAGLNLASVLAMWMLVPGSIPGPTRSLTLIAITAGLLAVSMRHRDQLERERQAQLRDSEERLRLALRAARMLTWEWDVASDRLHWAGAAEGFLGRPVAPDAPGVSGEAQGNQGQARYADYLRRVHPEDREAVEQAVRGALAAEVGSFATRHRVRPEHGAVRWIEAHGRVDRDAAGQPVRMRGTVFDVSGAQQAEAERAVLVRELEAKNAELERFTYTVSHDLKSPLVTIRGFLGFLEKDALEGNQDRLRADILRINEATGKMGRLLDELLELSRVGRVVNPPQPVPFAELARDAVSLVAGRVAERGVRVEIADDLPVVWGDRVRLLQVAQNLLDNAVKFLGDRKDPRVEVGARRDGDETVLYVRDNGIGIDERHRERVFGLFDKLDPDSEGTGVGLALVRRIVERHGGRTWVESAGPGTGSTFCFTLPAPPAEAG